MASPALGARGRRVPRGGDRRPRLRRLVRPGHGRGVSHARARRRQRRGRARARHAGRGELARRFYAALTDGTPGWFGVPMHLPDAPLPAGATDVDAITAGFERNGVTSPGRSTATACRPRARRRIGVPGATRRVESQDQVQPVEGNRRTPTLGHPASVIGFRAEGLELVMAQLMRPAVAAPASSRLVSRKTHGHSRLDPCVSRPSAWPPPLRGTSYWTSAVCWCAS